jgi:hypothetical protein
MTYRAQDPDRLYDLLPALYRIADEEHGGQLHALLALINRQADDVRADILQLWDDYFIETCQRWVIPYLGDLVGNVPLEDLDRSRIAATTEQLFTDLRGPDLMPPNPVRLRADVAKTIYYRRRKGTPAMLEELARDVTGWDARAVEFFSILSWTQNLEHLRAECHGCPDLRSVEPASRIGSPWDAATHTVDVRAINEWDGWYDIPNIGFFLWRLKAMPHSVVVPRRITVPDEEPQGTWRFTFSPLGQVAPVFSAGDGHDTEAGRATELTIESPIRPAAFFADLALPRAAGTGSSAYYGPDGAARLVLYTQTAGKDPEPVSATDIRCLNLSGWGQPSFNQPEGTQIGVDVGLGRLAMPKGRAGQELLVSYCDGFSADLGGGEYSRRKWLAAGPAPIQVSGGGGTLQDALDKRGPAAETVLEIMDSLSYDFPSSLKLEPGEKLTIQAADQKRPHVLVSGGVLSVGTAATGAGAWLTLNGLLVEGALHLNGGVDTFRLLHSTLVPGLSVQQGAGAHPQGPSLVVVPEEEDKPINTNLKVQIASSIVGALRMPEHVVRLWLLDSIVDGVEQDGDPKGHAVCDDAGIGGPPAHIERSTLLGASRFFDLELASESIFAGPVRTGRRQSGCVRFCHVPPGSDTPQQYRCQPALEITRQSEQRAKDAVAAGLVLPAGWQQQLAAEIGRWLVPSFESVQYGRPDYLQLHRRCPAQIRTGAEDGSEMGAFSRLNQAQREANLRLRLDEYLPIGLQAGLLYIT